jgi:hypothetical protein
MTNYFHDNLILNLKTKLKILGDFIMKKLLITLFFIGLFFAARTANAATIFGYEENWGYYQASGDEYTWDADTDFGGGQFDSADLSSFKWDLIVNESQAAFGDRNLDLDTDNPDYDFTVHTLWEDSTGLALQKTFTLTSLPTSALLSFGIDNGAIIFINGNLIARVTNEGYGWQDEYVFKVDPSILTLGENKIQVLAMDNGGDTYFDAKLEGNFPTPEPSSMLLGVMGIGSLLGFRRRK